MSNEPQTPPPYIRAISSVVWPIGVATLLAGLVSALTEFGNAISFMLGGMGLIAAFFGRKWYGVQGLGIRGGRPMMAGIGFALLGWIGFLVARFISIGADCELIAETNVVCNTSGSLGPAFLYLLIFEALCVQLWAFGIVFRSIAEWRGAFSAAVLSGVLYGLLGFFVFRESYGIQYSIAFFVIWGIFYGMIRLRTGSFLGPVVVQALQALTAWYVVPPAAPYDFAYLYGIAGIVYLFFTWRLLPRLVSDIRL